MSAPQRRRALDWWVVFILAVPIAAYAFWYLLAGERAFPPDLAASFRARPWGIYSHALFGGIAVLLGPLQFRRDLLRRRRLHRAIGLGFVVTAALTGAVGLAMAPFAFGGAITRIGFGSLGAAVLVAVGTGYRRIRGRDVAGHREWMIRAYALIFAAVTLRLELPFLTVGLGGFLPAYQVVAWSCWVPNLVAAELYLRSSRVAARATLPRIADA